MLQHRRGAIKKSSNIFLTSIHCTFKIKVLYKGMEHITMGPEGTPKHSAGARMRGAVVTQNSSGSKFLKLK